jgi:hypothetical protein
MQDEEKQLTACCGPPLEELILWRGPGQRIQFNGMGPLGGMTDTALDQYNFYV